MKNQHQNNSICDELKRDYIKAREKHDFTAMREIYTELWIQEKKIPFPDYGREEFVFFAEISDDNSVILPHELSDIFGKKCYISLFDNHINIAPDNENDIIEDYVKSECLEFKKIIMQNKFEFSPFALSTLKLKNGDIVQIELYSDLSDIELNIYNEADNLIFELSKNFLFQTKMLSGNILALLTAEGYEI